VSLILQQQQYFSDLLINCVTAASNRKKLFGNVLASKLSLTPM